MPAAILSTLDEGALRLRLHASRAEVAVPGYWETIAQNSNQWADEITVGPFWRDAGRRLDSWHNEYKSATGADLLTPRSLPAFVGKSAKSIEGKIMRKLRKGDAGPSDLIPAAGPPVPLLPDLVRTRIACLYLDGVDFLATKLAQLASNMNLKPNHERQGRIEGYYAQHVTFQQQVYFRSSGEVPAQVTCEIQVATQMACRMWEASHPVYEKLRNIRNEPDGWQWKPAEPQFISNQLGHMIHLADGLLVQLRQSLQPK